MKKKLVILFTIWNLPFFAQKITVINAETGNPVKEVEVYNQSKTIYIFTNSKGIVDVSIFKKDEIIIFSHISYAKYRVKKLVLQQQKHTVFLIKEDERLNEVVLSVFKKKEKTNRIAEQVAVVSLRGIQKISPQTSADLLASISGIKVQKSQFGGGSPILRGMESNRVLLVVDGVRMNNAIYRKGHLQNSITLSPNLLYRTEIIFGPSSVIYGSDALGGVIHYYTKTPKTNEIPLVNSNFFSRFSTINNELTANVSTELSFPKWASFTNISYSTFGDLTMGKNRSHGFNNWGKVPFYSKNTNTDYFEKPTINSDENIQRNTGYHQTDILQKLVIPLSKKTNLKINLQYSISSNIPRFDKLTELKSGTLKFAEWYYGSQQRLLISPRLEIYPNKKWLQKGTFIFAYQNIKESRIQRKFGNLNRSYRKETVNIFSLNGDFSVPLTVNKKRNLLYGFEFSYNDVGSNSYGKKLDVLGNKIIGFSNDFAVQSRYPDGGSKYISFAIYTGYRQDIGTKSNLNTGIRITNTHLSAKWIDETFIKLSNNNINVQNTAVTATVGYVYKPVKNWQINTVLSSGFRSPNIDDIGKAGEKRGQVTVPNIYLKPEYAYNAEMGVQRYFNQQKFKVGVNIYYTLLHNYIYRDAFQLNKSSTILYDNDIGNIVANQNKGNAYITGFTANYQGKLNKNWMTSGFITYTKGKTYDTNEPMSSIPPLFGNFEINYINHKFEIGVNIRFNTHKKITNYNLTEGIDNQAKTPIVNPNAIKDIDKYYGSPSWMTAGVNAKYNINSKWAVEGMVTNIFDEHYKEFASGISAYGRNFSIALRFRF